jgi:hypothetical protein
VTTRQAGILRRQIEAQRGFASTNADSVMCVFRMNSAEALKQVNCGLGCSSEWVGNEVDVLDNQSDWLYVPNARSFAFFACS